MVRNERRNISPHKCDCKCSINSIDYDATDLIIVLDRFDNNTYN